MQRRSVLQSLAAVGGSVFAGIPAFAKTPSITEKALAEYKGQPLWYVEFPDLQMIDFASDFTEEVEEYHGDLVPDPTPEEIRVPVVADPLPLRALVYKAEETAASDDPYGMLGWDDAFKTAKPLEPMPTDYNLDYGGRQFYNAGAHTVIDMETGETLVENGEWLGNTDTLTDEEAAIYAGLPEPTADDIKRMRRLAGLDNPFMKRYG